MTHTLTDNAKTADRAILIGVDTDPQDFTIDDSLSELEQLADTAGVEIVGICTQKRTSMHPGTYVGKGKLEEIKEMIEFLDATCIICDDELSPAQMRNVSDALDCRIIDRTMLILDIFALHAHSREGIIQVELAQQRYRLTRLTGAGSAMSRLGGGIGTRGPGEKKLEMDRRTIHNRISLLKDELKTIETHRTLIREKRKDSRIPQLTIVGYTNAGKSTLLNRLTDAGVLAENKLFATLDATTRKLTLPSGTEVLLSDTVGFIGKLPHDLVNAFKSTLDEAKYADILIHVADLSNQSVAHQMDTVYDTLQELEATDIPFITVYNKMDALAEKPLVIKDSRSDYTVPISAKTGDGIDRLLETLETMVTKGRKIIDVVIPYHLGGLLNDIRKTGQLLDEEHLENGTRIRAYVDAALYGQIMKQL
jgi:GTP-binding protein HflX